MFASTILNFARRLKYLDDVKRFINVARLLPSSSEEILSYSNNNEILAFYKTTIFKRQYYNKNNNNALWVYV